MNDDQKNWDHQNFNKKKYSKNRTKTDFENEKWLNKIMIEFYLDVKIFRQVEKNNKTRPILQPPSSTKSAILFACF